LTAFALHRARGVAGVAAGLALAASAAWAAAQPTAGSVPAVAAPTSAATPAAAPAPAPAPAAGADGQDASRLLIIAVADGPEALPGVGGTPRADYRRLQGYAGSGRALALAAELARDYALQPGDAWTIVPLGLRCTLFRLPTGADRDAVLAALARDPRVELAQPLNRFETWQAPPPPAVSALAPAVAGALPWPYNDPYAGLQRGLLVLAAAQAQRYTQGQGVRVAVIDTGIDAAHPDLQGRVTTQRDFAAAAHPLAGTAERHGTAVAGLIAAGANNGIGIVGIAPQARLIGLRACWAVAAPPGAARCDSFTLAQALGAAITAEADVINLSLGGPADPLLSRLAAHAMARGAIIVGALPPSGRREGFPSGVPGVLTVGSSDDTATATATASATSAGDVLTAPGRDILSLAPGGSYDYSSGSSVAAAQVSGVVALLRALRSDVRADAAQRWLAAPNAGPVDACAAVRQLHPPALCGPVRP